MSNRWLDQVKEDIIDPERPIIDPHHHLWNDKEGSDYELDKLWADTSSGHNILGTVFVECSTNYRKDGPKPLRPVGETAYVAGMAADSRRGIRHSVAYYPDPPAVERYTGRIRHLLLDEDFRQGFAELASAGLSFDAWLTHEQIPELTDIARAFPETTIVFDHFGGPMGIGPFAGKQAEIFEQWKLDVADLARCDNVVAKLGGLAMPINGWGWNERDRPASSDEIVAAHEPYYLHSIDCFGPDRCMFESNFPVDKASCSYDVLWNQFKKLTGGYSADERAAMFHDTAARVYRLETV